MSSSFTYTYSAIVRDLKTPCLVSLPINPKLPKSPSSKPFKFTALWDTGATSTVISKSVATALNLTPIGKGMSYHAGGSSQVNVYMISIMLPNKVLFHSQEVIEAELNGCDILIGMDIITTGDFSISNFEGKTTFSFRIPSQKTLDFIEEEKQKELRKKEPIISSPQLGRNALCHCGSGKKYKKCCSEKDLLAERVN